MKCLHFIFNYWGPQMSGALNRRLIREILSEQQNHRCCYCGERCNETGNATVEHVIPKILGGSNLRSNLVMACEECNKARSALMDWNGIDFRQFFSAQNIGSRPFVTKYNHRKGPPSLKAYISVAPSGFRIHINGKISSVDFPTYDQAVRVFDLMRANNHF